MTTITRNIGETQVSAIGFGAMGISGAYGPVESDEERFKVLDRAYELGCTHWDMADVYGDSEELIGKWFKRTKKRGDIFLATKFGFTATLAAVRSDAAMAKEAAETTSLLRGDAAYVKEAVERSLTRLGVEHIDLLYQHRVDKNTPIEETVSAMAEFVKAGKVKYLGLSECSSDSLRRAHAVHPIAAVQVEYSPFTLDIENPDIALLKTARELGVKIVAYSPLGRGLLTGQYKAVDDFEDGDFRKAIPLYREKFPQILEVVDQLKAIGHKHGATAGQTSLAWLLAQGDDIIPIPGTKKIKYLEENIGAAKLTLTPDEVQGIRKAIVKAGFEKASKRYPPRLLEQLFADSPPLALKK